MVKIIKIIYNGYKNERYLREFCSRQKNKVLTTAIAVVVVFDAVAVFVVLLTD